MSNLYFCRSCWEAGRLRNRDTPAFESTAKNPRCPRCGDARAIYEAEVAEILFTDFVLEPVDSPAGLVTFYNSIHH